MYTYIKAVTRYTVPRDMGDMKILKDFALFSSIEEAMKFKQGKSAYDVLDNSVSLHHNELVLRFETYHDLYDAFSATL